MIRTHCCLLVNSIFLIIIVSSFCVSFFVAFPELVFYRDTKCVISNVDYNPLYKRLHINTSVVNTSLADEIQVISSPYIYLVNVNILMGRPKDDNITAIQIQELQESYSLYVDRVHSCIVEFDNSGAIRSLYFTVIYLRINLKAFLIICSSSFAAILITCCSQLVLCAVQAFNKKYREKYCMEEYSSKTPMIDIGTVTSIKRWRNTRKEANIINLDIRDIDDGNDDENNDENERLMTSTD